MKGFKIIFLIVIISLSQSVAAQYFGENKVCYEKFDFTISSSPHFDIYNYLDNDKLLLSLNKQMENWYIRHYSIFGENTNNNAIIIYNNKPDFKQTNVISGLIGVGTGGVTEGFRKRIIMPLFTSNKEVNHVIGHELVHVFQYNMMKESDSLSLKSLQNTPLWMVEGLAEYMSLGSTHNKTAMWMRDAVYHNDIPSIKDMTRRPNEYFPYRYGHAFWAFLTGMYGDRIIQPFFYNTACYGMKKSVKNLFHISLDSLSCLWQSSIEEGFGKYIINNSPPVGKQPFNKNRLENINILPVLSPNGKKLAFLSNKNVISIDVLIADLESGEISNELTKPVTKAHIDDYNFIESAGSWSPDGKKYVMTSI
ncbi:MAG: basic secretory protein-like protein, partial [Bacteroidota bacterium]|nr:basic secretory protein-like protein [Bacteroidota bacterium]